MNLGVMSFFVLELYNNDAKNLAILVFITLLDNDRRQVMLVFSVQFQRQKSAVISESSVK